MKRSNEVQGRKGRRGRKAYDISLKRKLSRDYIEGTESLRQLSSKFGIPAATICRWSQQFYSELAVIPDNELMTKEEQQQFDELQKQVKALQKKLEYEQMRNFALETMADLAKTELGIDIRKNFGAKQPGE